MTMEVTDHRRLLLNGKGSQANFPAVGAFLFTQGFPIVRPEPKTWEAVKGATPRLMCMKEAGSDEGKVCSAKNGKTHNEFSRAPTGRKKVPGKLVWIAKNWFKTNRTKLKRTNNARKGVVEDFASHAAAVRTPRSR